MCFRECLKNYCYKNSTKNGESGWGWAGSGGLENNITASRSKRLRYIDGCIFYFYVSMFAKHSENDGKEGKKNC
jgi:hypothetical protein